MTNPVYIAIAADDHYARHMGIVAISLLSNTQNPERLYFFFLDAGISADNRRKLSQVVTEVGAQCRFIRPDNSVYDNITTKRYGIAALFRLSLSELLPVDVETVVYLDCDIIAFDDITKLWNYDLQENIVGAVTNLGHQPGDRLQIPDGEYFNSGMLIINLARWREQRIGEQILAYMIKHNENLIFPDQDGLNYTLSGKWQHLPLRWNMQPATYSMYNKQETERSLTISDYAEAIRNPGLVHYLGNNKPWDFTTFHPLKDNYWAYIAKSPWNNSKPERNTVINCLKRILHLDKNLKRLLRRRSIPLAVRMKGF